MRTSTLGLRRGVGVLGLILALQACGDGSGKVAGPTTTAGPDQESPALPADSTLAAAVREAAVAQGASLDSAGLAFLVELNAADRGVASLEGLPVLRGLRTLDLSGNRITDLTPLAGLCSLQVLDLADNRISDLAPLAGLSRLRILDLSGNQVDDLTPLASLPDLAVLLLLGNRLTEVLPLLDLSSLDEVELSGNPLSSAARDTQIAALQRRGVRVTYHQPTEENRPADRMALAFNSEQKGLTVLEYPDGELTVLPVSAGYGGYDWAPDGQSLVVPAKLKGEDVRRLYLVGRDGANLRPLSQQAPVWPQYQPNWSPAGDRLAFMQFTNQMDSRMALIDPTSGTVTLTPFEEARPEAWSPDGRFLAYGGSYGQLRLVDVVAMTETVACTVPYAGTPAWSPDGSMIAFTAMAVGDMNLDLYLWHVGEATAAQVAGDPTDSTAHGEPVWAPDGSAIAYLTQQWATVGKTRQLARSELHLQAPEGTVIRVIDLERRNAQSMDWSPDGTVIALAATVQESSQWTVYAVDPQTGTLVDLLPSAHEVSLGQVSWAPR